MANRNPNVPERRLMPWERHPTAYSAGQELAQYLLQPRQESVRRRITHQDQDRLVIIEEEVITEWY